MHRPPSKVVFGVKMATTNINEARFPCILSSLELRARTIYFTSIPRFEAK